jgi:hypothetical protein
MDEGESPCFVMRVTMSGKVSPDAEGIYWALVDFESPKESAG